MAHFPFGRTGSVERELAAILCLALCLLLPHPGIAHPATEARIDDLSRRIAADPGRAGLFLQRGELHREHRSWDRAEADYVESRRLDPDLAAVDFCLARMRFDTGRHAEAIALLDRYLTAAPGDGAALALRARVRSETGEQLAAAQDYGRAIAAWRAAGQPPPPHHYLGRAASLVAAGEAFVAEALEGLDEGLELLGRPVTLELEALELELRLGRFDEALARVDRRLAEARRPGPWLIRRGLVLEGAGRYEESLRAYGSAYDDFDARPAGRRHAPAVVRQLDSITTALTRVEARLHAAEGQADD
jgi:tetratricopeptide (TPR) repeat protein